MKKTLLVLLLTLCMVLCFAAFTASAEETHTGHCVCGGAPTAAEANHSCEDITWQPLPEGTTDFGTLAAGNYYLTGNVTLTAATNIKKDISLCLNGHTINTQISRLFEGPRDGGILNITDCSYDAETKTWDGYAIGGNSVYGGITYTRTKGTLNIYGGNLTTVDTVHALGGLIVIAQDGSATSTSTRAECATMNLYNGNLYGGKAGDGGNVYVMHACVFNMYGGTITDGEAHYKLYNTSSKKYGFGGNVYIGSAGELNMYGGIISDGQCVQNDTSLAYSSGIGLGGNIYNAGTCNISGGEIFGGIAAHNPVTNAAHSAYVTNTSGNGRGGNIYTTKTLNISGGKIYDGQAYGTGGGNILQNGGTVTISGGMIWGGVANADKDAGKSEALVNAYDVCGGSIRVNGGTLNMTAGTIGIDPDGNPAGGTCYPTNSEAGNVYFGSSSAIGNFSGGEIAYGNVIGLNADGSKIYGQVSKGGNMGGSAKITYSGTIIIRDGYATNGGNITLFNSGNTKIQGGKIYGGTATNTGGNIIFGGNKTDGTVYELAISGGEIYGGTAKNGGNIYSSEYNKVTMTGGKIYNGTASVSGGNLAFVENSTAQITGGQIYGGEAKTDGGNIYADASTNLTIKNITIKDGETGTNGGGANLLSTGKVTLEKVTFNGGNATTYAGGNLRMNTSTSEATVTDCTFIGGNAGSYGGNAYIEGTATFSGCTFTGGTSATRGGSFYAADNSKITITNSTFNGGKSYNTTQKYSYGGNLYSLADELTVSGCTFENGQAQSAGNVYVNSGVANFTDCIFKNGDATLRTDGSTNGNGGNFQSSETVVATLTSCIFEGGKAQRGGSLGIFGDTRIIDCTIGAAEAVYGGAALFVYQKGFVNISGNTVITGGTCNEPGAAIHFNSYEATGTNVIGNGVKVTSGNAPHADCIYVSDGVVKLSGAPQIDRIFVNNAKDGVLDVTELTVTQPIALSTSLVGQFGTAETDKIGRFVSDQEWGLKYEDGALYTCAPKKLYVASTGSDSGNRGSNYSPYKTVGKAIAALEDGGTIVIVDVAEPGTFSASGKHITITGGEFNITTADRLELRDHITFKDTIFTMPKQNYFIYCNGFTTVIDSTVTVRYLNGTEYTTDSTTSYLYGGSRASYITANGAITGTDLTVMSGVWGYIFGGNNENVDMTGDVHLTVGGKVNQGIDYASHTKSSNYLIIGGSRNADIFGTIYMNVTNGTTGTSINGGSNGECHVDKVELRVTGGEGMAIYGGGRGGVQTIDTINFYYEGGTFEQVFGGSLSYCLTGNVNLHITGGKITRRVYGGCYSNCDESSGNWTADNFVTGNVNLFIGSGANISCDLKNPNASGITGILTGGKYADRGIYGHSRREAPGSSDAENATIIFLDQTAYNNNKSKLTAQDTIMASIMNGVSAADLIYYLSWEVDDTLDTISHKATAVKDPETGKTGDASAYTKSTSMTLSGTSFYRNGKEITPATVITTANWDYEAPVLTYANNVDVGTATVTMTAKGYTVTATFDIVKKAEVAEVDGKQYEYLQDAVDAVVENGYMKILIDCDEDITISKTIYLDLAGNKLTGKVTVAEGIVLYGVDSTTDDYDCSDGYGEITNVKGEVATQYKATVNGKIRRYLTYTDPETGAKSFHRIYLGVTSLSLRPAVTGVGYKATFRADTVAQSMLDQTEAFGYSLWLEGMTTKLSCSKTAADWDNSKTVTLRVQGMPVDTYGETEVYANVYIKLADGTVITSSDSVFTLRQMLEAINTAYEANPEGYSATQLKALADMLAPYAEFLQGSDWNIDSIMPQA